MRARPWQWLGFTLLLLSAPLRAEYPQHGITLIAPFGPGGASDLAARNLAAAMPGVDGPRLMVLNRAGAGGTVGAGVVLRARRDGYTLLLARIGPNALAPALQQPPPYAWDDFTLLGLLERNPFVITVRADSPWPSLEALMADIRAHPGHRSCATSGPHSLLDVGVRLLLHEAGLSTDAVIRLPYRGGGGAVLALLGGHVDFLGANLGAVVTQLRAGKLRALAVSGDAHLALLPSVPTLAEVGYPDAGTLMGWSGLWGPPGLPQDVVDYWRRLLLRVSQDRGWIESTRKQGSLPTVLDGERTRAYVAAQVRRFGAARAEININGPAR